MPTRNLVAIVLSLLVIESHCQTTVTETTAINPFTTANNISSPTTTAKSNNTTQTQTKIKTAIGYTCDPAGNMTLPCGENAICDKIKGCLMGICNCSEGYKQISDDYDCFKILAIGDPCLASSGKDLSLLPEGAKCDASTGKVMCVFRPESGPCKDAIITESKFLRLWEVCSNPPFTKKCNEDIGHICVPFGSIVNNSYYEQRCECSPFGHYVKNETERCVRVNYNESCNTNEDCWEIYTGFGLGKQSVCKGPTRTCGCADNFKETRLFVYRDNAIATLCMPKTMVTSGSGETCSSNPEITIPASFCKDGSYCLRCPEESLNKSHGFTGRCVEDDFKYGLDQKKFSSASIFSGSLAFCTALMWLALTALGTKS